MSDSKQSAAEQISNMDKLTHRTLITSPENLQYSYYLSPDFNNKINKDVPTLMFLHGYPDDAYMWAGAVPTFLSLPYPFIIIDLLGFGDSSKPVDASLYNYKTQSTSISQILDLEKVPNNVIPMGHDWGSATSQRFYLYNKHRCIGLCLLSLAYQIPSSQPFDLKTANEETSKRFGYPQWEYWNFFCRDDAANLMRKNIERFYEVNHGNFPSPIPEEKGRDIWMREMFCTPHAMDDYVTQSGAWSNRIVDLKPYAKDPDLFARFKKRMTRDGFEGPMQYYHSLKNNTMLEDEKAILEGENGARIEVPLLYIGQTGDWVCRTDLMDDAKKAGLASDLEEKVVEAGHWVLYEKPVEIAEIIKEWLGRRFPAGK
ncbi:Epoxide hydrolase A [Pseudocercospora fuligena]|uniref:Epoxide hydrolase A n=1 Tax=Pseudocercospora fuligena TaxID=685502 RepID=A0A8H6VLR4_9PEZI|nr:Epoxide hydrolase A [Pseudocercospora fuligena]